MVAYRYKGGVSRRQTQTAIGLMVVTGIVLLKLTILALAFGWF